MSLLYYIVFKLYSTLEEHCVRALTIQKLIFLITSNLKLFNKPYEFNLRKSSNINKKSLDDIFKLQELFVEETKNTSCFRNQMKKLTQIIKFETQLCA